MPAISFPVFSPSTGLIPSSTLTTRSTTLEPRSSHGGYVKSSSISAGVLVVFCLLGASLALLCWWLFVRRSGFVWRRSDWQDYKASILRRPEMRPDDAITVFSDGTTRRGGGSSCGARTVVLGELDTTYQKSEVMGVKPWGPRDLPGGGRHKKGLLASAWGEMKTESVFGKLRKGKRGTSSVADTMAQREKELAEDTSEVTETTYIDNEQPAPPLTALTRSETSRHRPTRRDMSYAPGDDRGQYNRAPRRVEESDSSSESETDSDDESDDESALQEQMGTKKGTKVYHHPILKEDTFWGAGRSVVERNGGGAGGTYGSSTSNLGKGYRASSVGSLSSDDESVASSNAGGQLQMVRRGETQVQQVQKPGPVQPARGPAKASGQVQVQKRRA